MGTDYTHIHTHTPIHKLRDTYSIHTQSGDAAEAPRDEVDKSTRLIIEECRRLSMSDLLEAQRSEESVDKEDKEGEEKEGQTRDDDDDVFSKAEPVSKPAAPQSPPQSKALSPPNPTTTQTPALQITAPQDPAPTPQVPAPQPPAPTK